MGMDLIDVCPTNRYMSLKELMPLYKKKKIEVTIKNLRSIYMKAYRIGYVDRKNISKLGMMEYAYKRKR